MNASSEFKLPSCSESGGSWHGGHKNFTCNRRHRSTKQLCLLLTCLASLANGASAAALRYVAEVYGSLQHDRQESLVAPVSTSVSGTLAVPPYGIAQWNVSASTGNGVLTARALYETASTNASGAAPLVGGSALAFVDDTLYFSRGQGAVQLAVTLALDGACNTTGEADCLGGLSVSIDNQSFFGIDHATEETHVRFISTDYPGFGDVAIPITYTLSVQGSAANGGISDGDFSHTAHLYLSAGGVTFRTESGQSYAMPAPALSIQSAGEDVLISWPASAQGYQLETTTNLLASNQWTAVTNPPAMVGLANWVTNSISSSAGFYRLKK
jgi:hypothetical protein